MRLPRTTTVTAALLATALLLTGCRREDARVRNLTAGIARDSAITVMGGPTIDRPDSWLYQGQFIEALLYRRDGVEGPLDSLTRRNLTPVIIINGELTGWGWDYWDSVAGANRITVKPGR